MRTIQLYRKKALKSWLMERKCKLFWLQVVSMDMFVVRPDEPLQKVVA